MKRRGLGELPPDLRQHQVRGESIGGRGRYRGGTVQYPGLPFGGPLPGAGVNVVRMRNLIRNVPTDAGSLMVLPGREDRCYLALQNQNAVQDIWYAFGVDAGLNAGFVIPPGGVDIFDVRVPVDSVYVWCAAADQMVGVNEGVPAE